MYAPKIAFTLISIGQCDDAGYHTEFAHPKCVIKSATSKTLLQAPKIYGLYCMDNELAKNQVLKDKSCCIRDSNGHQIGRIPQYHCLYHVDEGFSAHIAAYKGVQVHTLNKLHQKMGHISHAIVKCLIKKKCIRT